MTDHYQTNGSMPMQNGQGLNNLSIKHRILLVEDSPIVQKVHFMMLEKVGCQVDVADDGFKALAMFENNYDLIFMDIGLPGMSGIEVTTQIRQRETNGKHTPIITLTAYSDEDAKNSCIAAGSDAVAIKPVPFADLQKLLQRWIIK